MSSFQSLLLAGAVLAGVGVALGAYGAHGLESHLVRAGRDANASDRLEWFETGVRYHLYHALALVAIAQLAGEPSLRGLRWTPLAFMMGMALFSGSLYAMALGSDALRKLGAVVPLGGLCFLLGWAWLAVCAVRMTSTK
ncbi:MAG: DUF423 domain-containing protein [Planctomycetota bacterium]